MINRLKTTWLLVFVYLCVLGCSDERMSQPMEMAFFDGGTVDVPAGTTIGPVPDEIALLLFGDREDLMGKLLGLPEGSEAAAEVLLDMICRIDRQREYYTKYIDAGGVAVVGHEQVDDVYFYNAREVILTMTSKQPEVREPLTPYVEEGRLPFYMVIFMGHFGFPTMPAFPNGYTAGGWCGRTCYAIVYPQGSGFFSYRVVVHEFAHAMHYAIRDLDPTFQGRLEAAYAVAHAGATEEAGYWDGPTVYRKGDYAMKNVNEYWAMGVERWFGVRSYIRDGAWTYQDEGMDALEWLERLPSMLDVVLERDHAVFRELDPPLYALLAEWLPDRMSLFETELFPLQFKY